MSHELSSLHQIIIVYYAYYVFANNHSVAAEISPPVSLIASLAIFFVNPMFTSISTGPSALGLLSSSLSSSSSFLLFFDFFVFSFFLLCRINKIFRSGVS